MHGFFTFRSRETFSTIGRVSTITSPAPTPAIPVPPSAPAPALLSFSLAWILFANSPHSFNAKAASSTLRFVARAISERVHRTLTCVSALPSSSIVVVNVRMLENWGSITYLAEVYAWQNNLPSTNPCWLPPPFSSVAPFSPSHPLIDFFLFFALAVTDVDSASSCPEEDMDDGDLYPFSTSGKVPLVVITCFGESGGKVESTRLFKRLAPQAEHSEKEKNAPQESDKRGYPIGKVTSQAQI